MSSKQKIIATLDGNEAAAYIAYRVNEVCAIYPITPSSRYVVKGDFARLANLTLSYDFGYLWSGFKGGRVYLTGQNLLLITGYTSYDPEARFDINDFNNPKYFPDPNAAPNYIPSVGIDFAQYPSPRAFILGVNFTL